MSLEFSKDSKISPFIPIQMTFNESPQKNISKLFIDSLFGFRKQLLLENIFFATALLVKSEIFAPGAFYGLAGLLKLAFAIAIAIQIIRKKCI